MKPSVFRACRMALIGAALSLPLQQAGAGIVSTEQVVAPAAAHAARERVRAQLQRADLRRDLVAAGVDPSAALERVDAMTDAEVIALAGRVDRAAAGGALSTQDLLLIIILVLVIALVL